MQEDYFLLLALEKIGKQGMDIPVYLLETFSSSQCTAAASAAPKAHANFLAGLIETKIKEINVG